MRCIVTYTSSTATEAFEGAERIFGERSVNCCAWSEDLPARNLFCRNTAAVLTRCGLTCYCKPMHFISLSAHAAGYLPDDLSIAQLREAPAEVQDSRRQ